MKSARRADEPFSDHDPALRSPHAESNVLTTAVQHGIAKPIAWRRLSRDRYVASIGAIDLRIHRNSQGWTMAIVADFSTEETAANPVLIQRALSDVAFENAAEAQAAALRAAEDALLPLANAYSDIVEWGMR